jgi:hypothetical protein
MADLWIAVGWPAKILTSGDGGLGWDTRQGGFAGDDELQGVATTHVSHVVASYTSGRIAVSADGITWAEASPAGGRFGRVDRMAAGPDNVVVAVGAKGLGGVTARSGDGGYTWAEPTAPPYGYLRDVTWVSHLGLWVAVGSSGAWTSPDGDDWTLRYSAGTLTYVGADAALGVIAGRAGLTLRSVDGMTWPVIATHPSGPEQLRGHDGLAVAAALGNITTSTDLATWTVRAGSGSWRGLSVNLAGDGWLAGGNSLIRSTDGLDWVHAASGFGGYFRGVSAGPVTPPPSPPPAPSPSVDAFRWPFRWPQIIRSEEALS